MKLNKSKVKEMYHKMITFLYLFVLGEVFGIGKYGVNLGNCSQLY